MKFRNFIVAAVLLFPLAGLHASEDLASSESCDVAALGEYSRQQIAERAGLHYLKSYAPGISRLVEDGGTNLEVIEYHYPNGALVTSDAELQRLRSLRIPVVYKNVWISTDPLAHIQATAVDSKNRTQYRYHPLWIQAKATLKFSRMVEFGNSLPRIQAREIRDISGAGLGKNKILATVAQIMERTAIRVGSEEYARDNGTYGLTTFLKSHMALNGDTVTFSFIGKASVEHVVSIEDHQIATVLFDLQSVPGDRLFQYLSDDDHYRSVSAPMLNDYLEEVSEGHFTAKDFRTWIGTVTATKTLMEKSAPQSAQETEKNIVDAIDAAAERLGNTRAVARGNYIEPRILQAYREHVPFEEAKAALSSQTGARAEEEKLVLLLLSSP